MMIEKKLLAKPVLVIIRGNSGSGKTTLADRLQTDYGADSCLVLHQDQLRRELLHAPDHIGTPAVALIQTLLAFGQQNYPLVILEGILRADVYGEMLRTICAAWPGPCLQLYLNVNFATCLAHNAKRFDEKTLRGWWRQHDLLASDDVCLPSADLCLVQTMIAQTKG